MSKLHLDLSEKDAVILDMNGTIINDTQYHRQAFQEFFKRHDLNVTEQDYKQKAESRKNAQIMPAVFGKALTEAEIDQYAHEKESLYREFYQAHVQVTPGFFPFIATVKSVGKKLGLATSSGRDNVQFIFDRLQLYTTFEAVVCGDDVVISKPEPQIYLLTAEKLGVTPERCVVFEDSPVGITAAKAAGMYTVGVLTGYSSKELHEADRLIETFEDIEL
jgi:beta-phosphoglucomutase